MIKLESHRGVERISLRAEDKEDDRCSENHRTSHTCDDRRSDRMNDRVFIDCTLYSRDHHVCRTYKEFIVDGDGDHDNGEIDTFFLLVILFFVEASFLMNYLEGENVSQSAKVIYIQYTARAGLAATVRRNRYQ